MPEYILEEPRRRGPIIPPTPFPIPTPIEKKPTKDAVASMARALRSIPGVTPWVEGERVGFHAEANSIQEMIQKLTQILAVGYTVRGKTMCDGEPVRIT